MKKLFTKIGFSMLIMLGISVVSFGQKMISGTITEEGTNEALIGANVLIEGTTNGTITDIDGGYSLEASEGDVLVISYTGFTQQLVTVGSSNVINVSLVEGEALNEVVVIGYGSQKEKEITSAVVSVSAEEFNQGPISDPAQLLQGKVAGLQVYNRGGDPNASSTIRLRGISTIGANTEPLVVVDGIIGASLDNVDPNDIASIDVLKDGSAAAIYGSRGSSGVLIVTTKKGSAKDGNVNNGISYTGQYGISSAANSVAILDGAEFVAAGGTDLGSNTDWVDEVTQQGKQQVHSISTSGAAGNVTYRLSGNIRSTDGILKTSGFDQYNTRLALGTTALDDKLDINFTSSFLSRNSDFAFNEALRYAVLYNPTAPVFGENSPFPFATEQFGGYFETLGLFDSFNPLSILEQNSNKGRKQEFNYGLNLGYNILDNLKANVRFAQQSIDNNNRASYATTSLFRGNAVSPTRKGAVNLYNDETRFKLFEAYATHLSEIGSSTNLNITAGYSFQQTNFFSSNLGLAGFPNNDLDFVNSIEASQDLGSAGLVSANSDASPDDKIIAFFARANATIDEGIFLNASIRREGSTRLGVDNQWGIFPAFGAGVDLNRYMDLGGFDLLKLRLGYGVTGSLPGQNGLAQPGYVINSNGNGSFTTDPTRAPNPDLKWEEKAELNFGIDFNRGKLGGSVDIYTRDISDFISSQAIDAAENNGFSSQIQNAGKLNTKGLEVALNYDVLDGGSVNWNTGVVFSTYSTELVEFNNGDAQVRGNLGAPGQNGTNMIRVAEGEPIGQIWGPVFDAVGADGSPTFVDINNDGEIIAAQDKALEDNADFQVLGNGIPDFELGWTNNVQFGAWNVNAFFRGAFGHSLVNTFRAFYEPRVGTQSSYNYVNTSLAVDGLTNARFSSLYVEKADFFKLDNLTISRGVNLGENSLFSNMNISITGQNLFVITGYTGTDPEPSLVDYGAIDNGGVVDLSNPDVLSPGLDRRNNYFTARTVTLGLNFNF